LHLKSQRAIRKKYKDKFRKLGQCIVCRMPVHPGYDTCLLHLREKNEYHKIWNIKNRERIAKVTKKKRERYKRENRCISCSAPLIEDEIIKGKTHCQNCIEGVQKERREHATSIV
jgi:hypothetical protein